MTVYLIDEVRFRAGQQLFLRYTDVQTFWVYFFKGMKLILFYSKDELN